MRQRPDDRSLAEALADAVLERAGFEEARDRRLADRDEDLGLEELQFRVQPVRAVGDARGRRLQVTCVGPVPTREASHQRRDVRDAAELFWVAKPGAEHPAVELFAGTPGEGPARLPLRWAGRLADEKKLRSPLARERGVGLGDDPLVGAHVAGAACGLQV